MSSSLPIELEARILWKSLSFFKWASAYEIDFIKFKVEVDYRRGLFQKSFTDGRKETIGCFSPQKKGTNITQIKGKIEVQDDYILELKPSTANDCASIICSSKDPTKEAHQLWMAPSKQDWFIENKLKMVSLNNQGASIILVSCTEESAKLATVMASIVVFLRFSH